MPQTILDKIVGTFSHVFFKVYKKFHNQELTLDNTTATLERGKERRNSLFSAIQLSVPFNFVLDRSLDPLDPLLIFII